MLDALAAPRRDRRPILSPTRVDADLAERVFDAQLRSRHLDHVARWLREQGCRLLHDRFGRARGQRMGGRGAAAHRPGTAALPLGRLLSRPGRPGAGPRRCQRRAARPARLGRRADRRWPSQGVRPSPPGRHPADVDDRLAPSPGARCGLRHRPGTAVSGCRRSGPTTPSPCAASATPRSTIPRRRVRSTPPPTPPTSRSPFPLLFVCEDNGWGISVPSPAGWVAASLSSRPGDALRVRRRRRRRRRCSRRPSSWPIDVRSRRAPAVLHLRTVRFGGHAGTDVEAAYRTAGLDPRRSRPRPAARHRPAARRHSVGRHRTRSSSATSQPRARFATGPPS